MHFYMITIMFSDGSRYQADQVQEDEVAPSVQTAMNTGLSPVGIAIVRYP